MSHRTKALAAALAATLAGAASRVEAAFVTNPTITNSATPFSGAYPASNVFDNGNAEYASQGLGVNTFIDFDFGSAVTVDAFDIVDRPQADRNTEFDLIFSGDATFGNGDDSTVHVIQDYSGVGAGSVSYGTLATFAPKTARYVRFDVTSTAGAGASNQGATEIRFRSAGANVRLAPASVNVYNGTTPFGSPTYQLSNASDGALGNGGGGDYSSNTAGSNTFLDFDLGSTKPVTGFELLQRIFAGDQATSFDLLFSNDSTFASGVTTRNYSSSGAMSVSDTFAAINARYVRFDVTGGSGNIGMQEITFLTPVPEPAAASLLGVAAAALLRRRRLA